MLSWRRHTHSLLATAAAHRTAARRSYSNKVRVFPFAISKEKAIAELSWNTSLFTGEKLFGTWLRHLLPDLDIEALRPIRVTPVYLPTWIIDAELEATVWSKKQESDDHFLKDLAQVQFRFVYVPLSSMSLMTPQLIDAQAVPWSEELRRYDGDNVLCLPYSLTPFRLPDVARSLSMTDANVSNLLRFEPSTVKETMMAAYPVLIPTYLAQYKVEALIHGKPQDATVSAFLEAAVPNGRAVVEVLPGVEDFFNMFNVPIPDLFIRGPDGPLTRRFTNTRSLIANTITRTHRTQVETWTNNALGRKAALQRYRNRFFGTSEAEATRKVDWNDVRIRPFDPEERRANIGWLTASADLFLLKVMLQVYNAKREVRRAVSPRERGRVGQDADRDAGKE
ncbi:hypothetical protein C8Q78DRAFT_1069353 [Trametes maxima]|nr:hypothetical protein C8Q78DRAFT_1069353 [Trametes maxima]